MKIEFVCPRQDYLELREEIDSAVLNVLDSGQYIQGGEVNAFEEAFARYCQALHCVSVGNGLDALSLSLMAMGVGGEDEVIVPSHTFIATWLAVSRLGAVPVPVEPDPGTCNIDPAAIEKAITKRTRAVIPVHMYGQPADLDPIVALAGKYGIYVLEDAAQAHGARYKGQRLGAHGDAVAWSFYPTKNLGAMGDAGAVTTNDPALAEKLRMLCNYGSRVKYQNEVQGLNSRLDPVQAAILKVKLKYLDAWNERRRKAADQYTERFDGSPYRLVHTEPWSESVWHLFTVRHPDRDALQEKLGKAGVSTMIHYPIPPHLQDAYKYLGYKKGSFPVSEAIHDTTLSLPLSAHTSMEQIDYVTSLCLK